MTDHAERPAAVEAARTQCAHARELLELAERLIDEAHAELSAPAHGAGSLVRRGPSRSPR